MNLAPLYKVLARVRVLALLNRFVTKMERIVTSYRYDLYRSKYDLHDSFLKRRNKGINLYEDGEIRTGPGSYIGRYSRIKAGENTRVSIGDGCALSHNVAIYTTSWVPDQDFSSRDPTDFDELQSHSGDVTIGDNTWIGYGVFITPETEIGENSVVGANAVVTRDIPPHSIAVGSPAKVIKFKNYVSTKEKRKLADQYWGVLSSELREEHNRSTRSDKQ